MDIELSQLRKETVQILPDAKKNVTPDFFAVTERGPILESYGSRLRERQLRRVSRHEYLWMVQGAFAGVMKRIASTPWEIKGPDKVTDTVKAYYRQQAKAMRVKLPGKQQEDIEYWQEYLRQADFGRGWGSFVKKGVDFLRQDGGWYWEVIAPGDVMKAPTGPSTGLAYLDSLRCVPTGDPEYPVLYYDRRGKLHRMHHTRVVHLVDMPDGDEDHPGYGLCALSRAISIANREVLMGRYVDGSLDDKPQPGVMVAQGMTESNRNRALMAYREDQSKDEMPPWGKTLWFYGMDKTEPIELTPVAFSVAPEKFDFKTYTELDINALALALGVDVQELWQLTSGNMGSGQQSEILNQKSRGKTIGDLLTSIERAINDILPEDYTFEFKKRDAQEEAEAAANAQAWGTAVSNMSSHMTDDESRLMLANTVEQFREAVTDEKGEIQRRDDLDVQPGYDIGSVIGSGEQQTADDMSQVPSEQAKQVSTTTAKPNSKPQPEAETATTKPTDNTNAAPTTNPAKPGGKPDIATIQALLDAGLVTLDEAQRLAGRTPDPALSGLYLVDGVPVPRDRVGDLWESRFGRGVAGFEAVVNAESPSPIAPKPVTSESKSAEQKAYQSTLLDFENDFADLVSGALKGDVPRARFAIVSRAILKKYGRASMLDGLKEGGIDTDELDSDDIATFSVWLAENSGYLSDFADRIYKTDTQMTADARAQAWGQGSLRAIYQKGLLSADANSMREWVLGDAEHCPDCIRLAGQRHRLKDWFARELYPGSEKLKCSIGCKCKIPKVKGRGKGKY